MLPNRLVLIVVLLVYHTRTTSPLWRPCYDRYPLTITDRIRYYRLAYVIQKYTLSVTLISFCVYQTNAPGYHNHLCNPVTPSLSLNQVPRRELWTWSTDWCTGPCGSAQSWSIKSWISRMRKREVRRLCDGCCWRWCILRNVIDQQYHKDCVMVWNEL